MRRCRKRVLVGIWFLIALAMVLSPSPREWGPYHYRIYTLYEEHRGLIQPMAHFILMAVFAIAVSPVFDTKLFIPAVMLTVGAALLVGVFLEFLQLFTPASYARTFDLSDLLPSCAGALTGSVAWRIMRLFRKPASRSNGSTLNPLTNMKERKCYEDTDRR